MPYDPELGMRVYDPREGAQQGLQIGNAFNQAFQSAQDRKLRERTIAMAEQEAAREAGVRMRRQMALTKMQGEISEGLKDVPPNDPRFPELQNRLTTQSLINNASDLFGDRPEALGLLTSKLSEDDQKRLRDSLMAERDRAKLEAQDAEHQRKLEKDNADFVLRANDAASRLEIAQAKLDAAQSKLSPQAAEREDYAQLMENQKGLTALVKGNPNVPELRRMLNANQAKLEAFGLQHRGGLTATLQYDDQGRPIINLGEGKATVGTQTAMQTELANIKNAIVQIDQAKNVLSEKDLGVAGGIWDNLMNRWVAQVVPGAGDPTVSANRAQAQKAVDSYLMTQQQRGRLSAAERAEIRESLVNPQKLGESLPRARKILDTMAKMQKFEAVSRAKSGQQPLQDWMFHDLSQTEIKQLQKDGVITMDEALTWAAKAPRK